MANEFVVRNGLISLGGMTYPYTSKTSAYSIGANDYFINGVPPALGTITFTLPTAVGISGKQYIIKNSGSGTVAVATTSSQTIDGSASTNLAQYQTLHVESAGGAWAVINTSSGTSITNNVNNNVLTTTGSSTINGESNLTFDGNTLTATNGISFAKGGNSTALDINLSGSDSTETLVKYGIDIGFVGDSNSNIGVFVGMDQEPSQDNIAFYCSNSSTGGTQYGVSNVMNGNMVSGVKFGIRNNISGSAGGSYGVYNTFEGTGANYGIYNGINGTGGEQYGEYTIVTGDVGALTPKYGNYIQMEGTAQSNFAQYLNSTGATSNNNFAIYTIQGSSTFNVNGDPNTDFRINSDTGVAFFVDASANTAGMFQSSPTAKLHLGAGSTAAGTAPLKFTGGNLLTTAEVGALEYTTPLLYFTNGDAVRLKIPTMQFAYLDTVQSRTNNTYSNLTGLSVSLTAGRRYEIEAFVSIIAVSGAGAKLRFSYTGTMTGINTFSYTLSDAQTIIESKTTSGTTFAADEVTSATMSNAGFFFKGHIQASTTGTLTLQAAQNTTSVNTAFFDTGGFIKVTPII